MARSPLPPDGRPPAARWRPSRANWWSTRRRWPALDPLGGPERTAGGAPSALPVPLSARGEVAEARVWPMLYSSPMFGPRLNRT